MFLPLTIPLSQDSAIRRRRTKEAMIQINSALLKQFHRLGLSVNEGVAVDARLVKSASRPVSKGKLEKLKASQNPEDNLGKNGTPKKFSRDFDSDWTVKNDKPHYGLKEHTSVDTENGFILSTNLSPASHHDSKYLPLAVVSSMQTPDKIQTTYADKGYLPSGISLREPFEDRIPPGELRLKFNAIKPFLNSDT